MKKEEKNKDSKDIKENSANEVEYVEIPIMKGRKIIAKRGRANIYEIKLDKSNVRFRDEDKPLSEEEIHDIVMDDDEARDLCNEIIFAGAVRDPIIIDSKNVVREGTRRVVCSRDIIKKHPDEKKTYETVPAIFLPETMTELEIAIYLATLHVGSRKKTWGAFQQAAHIYDLNEKYGISQDAIKNFISMGKSKIVYMIKSYKTLLDFHKEYPKVDKWTKKYSYFEEFFKRSDLDQWNKDDEYIKKFKKWISEDKFDRGEQVRKFAGILKHRDVLKIFERDGATKAIAYLEQVEPESYNAFFKKIFSIKSRIEKAPDRVLRSILENEKEMSMLKDLKNEIDFLIKMAEKRKKKI